MNTDSACYSVEDMDIIHTDYVDTGYPISNRISRQEGTVWICPCGQRQEGVIKR